jgi:prophage antirepressor-like protein/predicted GIY-YIG superfamily endonuclease
MKDKLIDILSNAKVTKAKELLKLLQDDNTSTDILEIIDLNKNNNQLINFVDYKQNIIQFNNKQLKYFLHNEQFYFKAKDVAEILEYVDTKKGIFDHVNMTDKFTKDYFIPGFKGGETPPFQLIENKGSEKLPLQLIKTDSNLNKKVVDFLSKEHPQTIFINESGLYSLIFGSKKKEAIAFKQWVTSEVPPSIRKNGTYVSKKLLEYNKDELKNYYNKDCVYILHIKDNIYKYGKTSKIQDRFYKHSQNLDYINIEKIYILNSINETNIIESDIKELTKLNKINIYYNNGIEYFECNKLFTIENVIEKIDDLYKKLKKNTNSTDLLLEKILEKLDNIDSRLTELENNKAQINISGKCIDCNEETSKFATRCGKCDKKNKLKMAMEDGSKPSHAQLQKDLNELRFVSHVAKKYNVTPRIITKWLANYEKYNDNEMNKIPVKEETTKQPSPINTCVL